MGMFYTKCSAIWLVRWNITMAKCIRLSTPAWVMAPDHLLFCWRDYSHSYKNQITYKDQRQMYCTLHQIRLLRVTGALSMSENLARYRPTWFGGSGNFPAICAVDNDNDTCTTVRPNEVMVVDLGFNSNTTLHVIIIADGGYYIHTCAHARACVFVCNKCHIWKGFRVYLLSF